MSGYISNIPLSNQSLGQTQAAINNNFTQLNTLFSVDHSALTLASPPSGLGGYHKQVTFATLNTPSSVPADPLSIMFTKNNSLGHPYPYFLNSQAAAVASALPFLPDLLGSGVKFGFQIGQIIFNCGQGTLTGSSPATATIGYQITFPTQALYIGVQLVGAASFPAYINAQTTSGFTVKFNAAGNQDFYYLAIGN